MRAGVRLRVRVRVGVRARVRAGARVRASLALAIDEVKQQSTALGVAQEGAPYAAARVRSIDQPGDIQPHHPLAQPEAGSLAHAEVGHERREGVVGDLGRRSGDVGEERALARVRVADQADVGHQRHLEYERELIRGTGRAGLLVVDAQAPVPRAVALAAGAARGDQQALADEQLA